MDELRERGEVPWGTRRASQDLSSSSNLRVKSSLIDKIRHFHQNDSLCPKDLRVMLTDTDSTGTLKLHGSWIHKDLFLIASRHFAELFKKEASPYQVDKYSIKLPGVTLKEFRFVKKFLYTGELVGGNVDHLDIDMQLQLLSLSIGCEISFLTDKAIKTIKLTLENDKTNAFKVLDRCRNMHELETLCLDIIDENAEEMLTENLEDFCSLGHYDVIRILSRDTLQIKETTAFNAAVTWAKKKAAHHQSNPMEYKKSTKYHFKGIAPTIRFPVMSPQDLAQFSLKEDGIIDPVDLVQLFQYVCLPEKEKIKMTSRKDFKFKTIPRKLQNVKIKNFPTSDTEQQKPTIQPLLSPAANSKSISQSPQRKRLRTALGLDEVESQISSFAATNLPENGEKKVQFNEDEQNDDSDSSDFVVIPIKHIRSNKGSVHGSIEDFTRRYTRKSYTEEIGRLDFKDIFIEQLYQSTVQKNCENYTVDATYRFIRGGDMRMKDFKTLIKTFDPMRYLVFHRKRSKLQLTPADIWGMDQNILLKFNGVTFLKVIHQLGIDVRESSNDGSTDTLVLNYMRDAKEVLSSQTLKPTTLAMSNCEFSSKYMKERDNFKGSEIKSLILYRVWGEFTMEDLMKDYKNLEELVVWKYTPHESISMSHSITSSLMLTTCMDFTHAFEAKRKIKKLVLFRSELKFPMRCCGGTTITELYLDHCQVFQRRGYADIADVFTKVFPSLKRFFLNDDPKLVESNSLAKPNLIYSCLNDLPDLQWLRVVRLKWTETIRTDDASVHQTNEFQLGQLLTRILKSSLQPTNFLMQKRNGVWSGMDYTESQNESQEIDDGYHTEMDKMEYDWYNLKYFYDNPTVFEDYFINDGDGFPEHTLWIS